MDRVRWIVALLTVWCIEVHAGLQWDAGVSVASQYDDNVYNKPDDKQSENKNILGASVSIAANEARYQAKASYNLNRAYFSNSTNQDNSSLTGRLNGSASLIPRRLMWTISHTQTDSKTDSRLADTPDNTEQRSVLTTGPQISFYPSKRDSLSFSASYTDVDLEESSDNNSERYSGSIVWSRVLSKLSSLSVNASKEKSKYDSILQSDYTKKSYSIGINGQRALFDYSVNVGVNEIERETGDTSEGETYQITLSKDHKHTQYTLVASRELTDSVFGQTIYYPIDGTDLVLVLDVGNIVSVVERNDIVFRVKHDIDPNRLVLNAAVSQSESDGEGASTVDQIEKKVDVSLKYTANTKLSFTGGLALQKDGFNEAPPREDESIIARLSLNYKIQPRLNWSFAVSHENNDSTDSANEFEAWQAITTLRYKFGSQHE